MKMNIISARGETCSTHECVIKNLSIITEVLKSDLYLDNNKTQPWSLCLRPDGNNSESKGYVSISLYSHFEARITTKVRILLLDSNKNEITHHTFERTFSRDGVILCKFVKRDELFKERNELPFKDTFTLVCKIKVVDNIKSISLTDDFRKAFGVFNYCSDVTVSVDEKDFKLHKVILATRSPVFDAMFKHPMEEATTNIVKIPDVSLAVMDEVVRYIYTDETQNLYEMVEDILLVADKYELQTLKDMCEEELYFQLIASKAVHILELADLYNLAKLKEDAIDCIGKNIEDVVVSPRWKELTASKSNLIISTLTTIAVDHLNISSHDRYDDMNT